MLNVGVVGFGFMGRMHYRCYQALPDVRVAAIWDVDPAKLRASAGVAGNIGGTEAPLDLSGVELYDDFGQMVSAGNLDAVSITLPTYLHMEHTVRALEAGLNVLCEKPMALDAGQCDRMIAAAQGAGKLLQIGHCIRFWPEYVWLKEAVDSGRYGKVRAATFQRLSATPLWSWDGWLMDGVRSGGAALDLHIHDADFVQYLFGLPEQVYARGAIGPSNDYDHLVSQYVYPDGAAVTAEGGWMMAPGFGFQMSFHVVLDKATIVFDSSRKPAFRCCPLDGEAFEPQIEAQDAYLLELQHFARLVAGEKLPAVTTVEQSRASVALVAAEKRSARSGLPVQVR